MATLTRVCPNCGYEPLDEARFCVRCGTRLTLEQYAPPRTEDSQPTAPDRIDGASLEQVVRYISLNPALYGNRLPVPVVQSIVFQLATVLADDHDQRAV